MLRCVAIIIGKPWKTHGKPHENVNFRFHFIIFHHFSNDFICRSFSWGLLFATIAKVINGKNTIVATNRNNHVTPYHHAKHGW